jgi:hypothetical protein
MSTQRDDKTPATFKTPDGDIIQLMTWAGIVDKLEYLLLPIIASETSINESLSTINNKLDEWVEPEPNEDEEDGD